jgi:hypothetical protein
MASLFELLMDTMPIAGVVGAIERRFQKKDPREITEAEARSYLRYFPSDADTPPLGPFRKPRRPRPPRAILPNNVFGGGRTLSTNRRRSAISTVA